MARLSAAVAGGFNVLALDKDPSIIYCLKDPRDQAVRYVGITTRRLKDRIHVHLASTKRNPTRPVCAWLIKLAELELSPLSEVLEEVASGEDGYAREAHWIARLRGQGVPLLNCTDGGPGWTGHRHSAAERKKIGDTHKGKTIGQFQREKQSRAMRGRKLSVEHKAKVSAAMKGREVSEQTRRRLSEVKSGRPCHKTAGELNGRALLTPDYVRAIRSGLVDLSAAMSDTGISKTQFYRVKRGEQWGGIANG